MATSKHIQLLVAAGLVAVLLALTLKRGDEPRPVSAAPAGYQCGTSLAPDQAAANAELQNSYGPWTSGYVTSAGAGGGSCTEQASSVANGRKHHAARPLRRGIRRNPRQPLPC